MDCLTSSTMRMGLRSTHVSQIVITSKFLTRTSVPKLQPVLCGLLFQNIKQVLKLKITCFDHSKCYLGFIIHVWVVSGFCYLVFHQTCRFPLADITSGFLFEAIQCKWQSRHFFESHFRSKPKAKHLWVSPTINSRMFCSLRHNWSASFTWSGCGRIQRVDWSRTLSH